MTLIQKKNISIIEAQGNVGQAREVGRILSKPENYGTGGTAVVLGDENLMSPILQYFPKNLNKDLGQFFSSSERIRNKKFNF